MHATAPDNQSIDLNTSRWLVRLRWCALLGLTLGAAVELQAAASNSTRIGFAVAWLVLCVSNLFAAKALAKHEQLRAQTLAAMLFLDISLLTLILAVTGGPANPFSVLYLVHITLTAAVLGSRLSWAMAVSSVLAFGGLFLLDAYSTDPHAHHMMHGSHQAAEGFSNHLRGMWVAFALAAALISYFASKILASLKATDAEVAQMKLSIEQNNRFASLVTLAAGAAHELGSPLATIAVISSDLAHAATHSDTAQSLKEDALLLQKEVTRCRVILDEMRYQADSASPESWITWSREALTEAIQGQFTAKAALLGELDLSELPETFELPQYGLERALGSLIANARDAAPESGRFVVRGETTERELQLSVTDYGLGMPESVRARATEPFFTTKPTGLGMGLGLFLVRTFCEQHGGSLSLSSAPSQGTTATINLPRRTSGHVQTYPGRRVNE